MVVFVVVCCIPAIFGIKVDVNNKCFLQLHFVWCRKIRQRQLLHGNMGTGKCSLIMMSYLLQEVQLGKCTYASYVTTTVWEFKPIIKSTWIETRPTKKQLQPLELKDYHLIPTLRPSKVCCATSPSAIHQNTQLG